MPWSSSKLITKDSIVKGQSDVAKIPVKKIPAVFDEGLAENGESLDFLKKAEEEAQKIIANAQEEASRIYEEAKKEGLALGFKEGQEKAQKEYLDLEKQLRQQYQNLTDRRLFEIQEERRKILADLEPQVISFLETILKKLLGELPEATYLFYRKWLDEALKQFSDKNPPTIMVNPEELTAVREIVEQNASISDVIILTEPELEPGTVVVRGQENYVVSLKVFLEEVVQKLRDGV